MNLSKLTRMAAIAVDETESGNDLAAPQFAQFCKANADDVAHALCCTDVQLRSVLNRVDASTFTREVLKSCKGSARKLTRERDQNDKTREIDEVVAKIVAAAYVDGLSWRLDGRLVAELAKLVGTATFCITIAGIKQAIEIPLERVRQLDRVKKLGKCSVHVTCPLYHEKWKLMIQWDDNRGGYLSGRLLDGVPKGSLMMQLPEPGECIERQHRARCDAAAE